MSNKVRHSSLLYHVFKKFISEKEEAMSEVANNREEISALTGLRIIGAAWVALFHFQGTLYEAFPVIKVLKPILSQGYFGVPLFFILSGYIIWYNYGSRSLLDFRSVAEFVWRRFARLWPVNILTQLLAIPIIWITVNKYNFWGLPIPDWYSISGWLKSAFFVQVIGNEICVYPWNQPSWTLSGEMFAYIVFPLIVIVVVFSKLLKIRSKWIFLILSFVTIYIAQNNLPQNIPYSWMLYLLLLFIGGVLLCMSGPVHDSIRFFVVALQFISPLGIVIVCYMGRINWINVILTLWIYSLVIDRGPGVKFFSTNILKTAGYSSYSLYMIHWIIFSYGWSVVLNNPVIRNKYLGVFAVICMVITGLCSYLLWRFFETPARKKLNFAFKMIWPKSSKLTL